MALALQQRAELSSLPRNAAGASNLCLVHWCPTEINTTYESLPWSPVNKPPSLCFSLYLFFFFFKLIFVLVLGYEEVVRIPKGSVFIHIQELNISLNYLGKMILMLLFSVMVLQGN